MLNETEKEILDCLVRGWLRDEARLPGGISYQMVMDFVEKLGGDASVISEELDATFARYDQIAKEMGYKE